MAPSGGDAGPHCSYAAVSRSRMAVVPLQLLPLVVVVVVGPRLVVAGRYCCCYCSSWPVGAALEAGPPAGGNCGGVAGRHPSSPAGGAGSGVGSPRPRPLSVSWRKGWSLAQWAESRKRKWTSAGCCSGECVSAVDFALWRTVPSQRRRSRGCGYSGARGRGHRNRK